jgi:quercetin dioxygenase-like cupin family protein
VLVAGTEPPDVLELWDWTLAPGDRHGSEAHAPGTQEVLEVLEGSVAIEVGDEHAILHAGDAVSFDGGTPHAYSNPSDSPARFTLAVFEPGVGVSGRFDHA